MFRKKIKYICGGLLLALMLAGCVGYALHLKQTNAVAEQKVTRGVVESLNQLPDTKKVDKPKYKRGTKENPFLILEIVPYEEYAEFGYQISGCEPVDVEHMFGRGGITTIGTNGSAVVKQTSQCYFFPDETEGKAEYYDGGENSLKHYWADITLDGYYEKTDEGAGSFTQNENGSIVKKDGGDIIWHTVNEFEKDDYKDIDFNDNKTILKEKGDRRYTKRESKASDNEGGVKTTWTYYSYKNKDSFLLNTRALETQEQADNYSVVIKTITPKELNENPEWITYSNLISISNKSHDKGLVELWKRYNRLGHKSDTTAYKDSFVGDNRDISWNVVEKIYERAADEDDWAGVIIDRSVYDGAEKGTGKNVTFDVKDWNLKSVGDKYTAYGSNNNMYKLSIMLLSMDYKVFKNLYLNKDNPVIKDGKLTIQEGDAADYWTFYTFYVVNPYEKNLWKNSQEYYYWVNSEDKSKLWEKYNFAGNMTGGPNSGNWIQEHVFTYPGNMPITQNYNNNIDVDLDRFSDLDDYFNEYKDVNEGSKSSAVAIQYILQFLKDDNDKPVPDKNTVNILDIEPCYDLKNGYSFTESAARMLLADFESKINITHMTTAEYIGKTQDLNSIYDMIFMGLDDGAYNKDSNGKTVWNDSSMNGKIYFHTGDIMTSTEKILGDGKDYTKKNRSVDFLWQQNYSGHLQQKHITLRFAGNDITKIKKAELNDYANSGRPIVAEPDLYAASQSLIDQNSNICNFIKANKSSGVYSAGDYEGFVKALKTRRASANFIKTPIQYNGKTDENGNINEDSYLPKNSADQSKMEFEFKVDCETDSKFAYKIYIDQNQDGKYASDEIYYESDEFLASDGTQAYTCRLSRLFVGVVQWKIEIYNTANNSIRFAKTGCSAAKRSENIDKKKINVLQIMPSDKSYNGKLNLQTNKTFSKYYKKIQAYNINVTAITADEFENWFKMANEGKKFSYDMSEELSDANPKNFTKTLKEKFKPYNMLIFGFGDNYGKKNISNDYGAVDYIKYFIALGKSVLFTHDMTSMYNVNSADFGYVANSSLRDVMGMNRYMAVSSKLSDDERNELQKYQSTHKYDTVTDINGNELYEKHGFTYYAMKRLGYKYDNDSTNGEKMPYKYMIEGVDGNPLCTYGTADSSGFNNGNDLTTKIGKMNDGQVTSYPFKIDDTFTITDTHGQWYQLDMEDPEVTVWYSLIDDKKAVQYDKKGGGKGTAGTYAVSPYDAANNYYIYSKGNVFYSGVGHLTVNKDMEARLFINTMIAAYRAAYQPPIVDILNEEAEITDADDVTYQIINAQEYDLQYSGSSGSVVKKEDGGQTKVIFSPVELNAIKTKLDCSIYFPLAQSGEEGSEEGCTYIDTIYDAKSNQEIKANKDHVFENVKNGHEYYLKYDWNLLNSDESIDYSQIKFKIKNDKTAEFGYTTLDMLQRQLFELD